jgi:hypothetical protein
MRLRCSICWTAIQTRPRYYVKRVIDDGVPPRFHIVGHSHRDLLTAYQAAGVLRRQNPEMMFVAGEMSDWRCRVSVGAR